MKYWLIKSEPNVYPYEQLVTDKTTAWEGVRNYAARNNLRDMKKGDFCLFYHSNEGREIVGIASVVKESYQDPTTDNANWVAVDVKPVQKFKRAVTLLEIKAEKRLKEIELVRFSRLSVAKITKLEYDIILSLSES